MSQSLSNILLHIIFSTKHRIPLITPEVVPELHRYLTAVARTHQCPAHEVGGTEDHVHICCSLGRTQNCARLVEELKTGSSRWMKSKVPAAAGFSWQSGYGAFSISQEQLATLKEYLRAQPRHHATVSFQNELRELLRRYQVDFDERYVWD